MSIWCDLLRSLFLGCLFVLCCGHAYADVVFYDNFDSSPDWNSHETMNGTRPGNIGWGSNPHALQAPAGWSDYRAARGGLSSLGEHSYQVNARNGRGGKGKSLTVFYETTNNWAGGGVGKWLGDVGYEELYVRWYRKFQPGWQYRTRRGSAIHKLLRLMSNVDNPVAAGVNSPQNMYKVPLSRPEWRHNCDVAKGGSGGSPSGDLDPVTGTYLCGKQAYVILQEHNIAGDIGWGRLGYNPEGRAGSVSDLSKAFEPRGTQLLWKKYHGVWKEGSFPGSNYTGGDWVGNGKWVCYEIHARMNDVGSRNFLFELYVNGQKVGKVTDIALRTSPATRFNYLILADNMLNGLFRETGKVPPPPEGEQWLAVDDLVVSTHYSGPPPEPLRLKASPEKGAVRLQWTAGDNGVRYLLHGYRIHYGTDPENLQSKVEAGLGTEWVVKGLSAGTYYFAVTAYNKDSFEINENESLPSKVVKASPR